MEREKKEKWWDYVFLGIGADKSLILALQAKMYML
jgi:hypothetical protein